MKFACIIILFLFINIEQNQVLCQALNIEKINWKGKKVRVSSDFIVVKLKENKGMETINRENIRLVLKKQI